MQSPLSFLCISFYFKGSEFMRACKRAGHTVYLVTAKNLEQEPWPREAIDEFFYLEDDANSPENLQHLVQGMAWLLRQRRIDRIVALDDFDVEKGAYLREAFRIPGMGQTTARYFRDKLAMRIKAQEGGIAVPPFTAVFNDADINRYIAQHDGPWVLKPRSEASATGIKKVTSAEQLWEAIHGLGEDRHHYLLEQFKPGSVYHADALTVGGKVIFCRVSQYLDTPFEVAHGGGIFRSHTIPFGSEDDQRIQAINADVMRAFGLQFSASHTEFIKSNADGKFYFLETSSRVGGAHLAELVEASSGINLWAEWAKIEIAMALDQPYQLPPVRQDHAGIIISLARMEHPDTSVFDDPEIVWRMSKKYHVGLLLQAKSRERILELLDQYARRIQSDFHASAPIGEKPSN